jgi:hypothetical protein
LTCRWCGERAAHVKSLRKLMLQFALLAAM